MFHAGYGPFCPSKVFYCSSACAGHGYFLGRGPTAYVGGPDRCGSCCIRTGLADFKEHFQAAAKALQSDSNGGRGAQRTDQRDLFAFGAGNPETVL